MDIVITVLDVFSDQSGALPLLSFFKYTAGPFSQARIDKHVGRTGALFPNDTNIRYTLRNMTTTVPSDSGYN